MKQDIARMSFLDFILSSIVKRVLGGVLPHAVLAPYNCNEKLRPCYPGTRVDVLTRISEWAAHSANASEDTGSESSKLLTARVFWVNGPGSAGNYLRLIIQIVLTANLFQVPESPQSLTQWLKLLMQSTDSAPVSFALEISLSAVTRSSLFQP